MTSMPGYGVGSGNYGAGEAREPGARRRKLAAMAGSMYRAGATAVNEIRESYNQTRSGQIDAAETSKITIPGAFPEVAIVTKGNEQMVLFPSYAKRHVRNQARQFEDPAGPPHASTMNMSDHDYWQQEWSRHEDEKAIVDVDVRGWIYDPHRGPITRRNRMLIGLARQLSGIPAPNTIQQGDQTGTAQPSFPSAHQQREEEREQQTIAQRAKEIQRRGEAEEEAAQRGKYSEPAYDGQEQSEYVRPREGTSPASAPSSPILPPSRTNTNGSTQLSEAELAVANANLMARIAPFMTIPLVQVPITLFFYNDVQSQSRTVMTNESGHFITRAALDFVPTHVRVLANEDISCTEPIQIIEPKGISLISDIDDTIKHSNIVMGAKEIFRNTFIRDLNDMSIGGVQDWYNTLYDMGVNIHYCSNSPWQLYPVLATFLKRAGLPPGSLHLKQYSGMLQGIFEPVAERKKGTLEKIMRDFPERKFLLVGDSGEADLEVYTELAVANPGRIVAIFIRDVTTPERAGYFDTGFNPYGQSLQRKSTYSSLQEQRRGPTDGSSDRPALPRKLPPRDTKAQAPLMGDLIDFSEELATAESRRPSEPSSMLRSGDSVSRKPPPRPSKPTSLRSSPAVPVLTTQELSDLTTERKKPPPPPAARKPITSSNQSTRSSTPSLNQQPQMRSDPALALSNRASPAGSSTTSLNESRTIIPPPLPPPRRRGTPSSIKSLSPRLMAANNSRRRTTDSDLDSDTLSLSAGGRPLPQQQQRTNGGGGGNGNGNGSVDRRLDLWRRRLERAHDTLDRMDVKLYTWRRGDEVIAEAVGIVKEELKDMGVRPEVSRKG